MSKTVSQLDVDGYFVGFAIADESPLEPGTFLLPGGCVDAAPPAIPEGHRARWDGSSFSVELIPLEEPPVVTPPTPVVTPPTLDEVKAAKLAEINAACDAEIGALKATYPDTEVLTWDKQEQEARALVLDATATTPLIDSIASARGLDRVELANLIIDKADPFAVASGASIGKRQKLEDQINAATTVEQVAVIVW